MPLSKDKKFARNASMMSGRNIFPKKIEQRQKTYVELPKMSENEKLTLDAVVYVPNDPDLTEKRRQKLRYKFYFMQQFERKSLQGNKCLFCKSGYESSVILQIHQLMDHTLIFEAYKQSKKDGWFVGAVLRDRNPNL